MALACKGRFEVIHLFLMKCLYFIFKSAFEKSKKQIFLRLNCKIPPSCSLHMKKNNIGNKLHRGLIYKPAISTELVYLLLKMDNKM